jgi:hypothetical protein
MAVFLVAAGDPFSYEMDEQPFYDAVSDVSSDVFNFAADTRLAMQTETYSWGPRYFQWADSWLKASSDDSENVPLDMFVMLGIPLAYAPSFLVTVVPYTNPYTAAVAFPLDAYNIYRYLD